MSAPARTILIASPYFPPHGGGLELYVSNIATELNATTHDRIVIITSGDHGRGVDIEHHPGFTLYRLGYTLKLSNTPLGLRWWRQVRRIIATEQPDLINVHAPVPGLADIVASQAGHIPLVVTWHSSSMRKAAGLANLPIGIYEHLLMPLMMRRARRIICTSNTIRDEFLQRYIAKISVIRPGVDLAHFTPGPSPRQPTLLFVAGNFGPTNAHKGLRYLLEAMPQIVAAVPRAHLTVVGDGSNRNEYLALCDQLGVGRNVTFTGHKDGAALANAYRDARVFVHPALSESFGMVITEAMASGRPVVASAVGDIPTLIADGQSGRLVPPGDSPAIATAVIPYLRDRHLADTQGTDGRHRLAHGFSWTAKAAATREVFAAVLAQTVLPPVTFVTAYYPPHLGGMENVAQQLAESLSRLGYRVQVITSRLGGTPTTDPAQSSLNVRRLPSLELLSTPIMLGLFTNLLLQPRKTIVHVHISQALVPEFAWLAAKLRGFKLVSHIHLDVAPSSRIGQLIFEPYKRVFLGFVLRHSHRVIVFSEVQRQLMIEKYGLERARLHILPNGVAAEHFRPARTHIHTPLSLLYVGRLSPQKRVDRIIAAMPELPEAHLHIVGDGQLRSQLEAQAASLKLSNITFHGHQQGAALQAFYDEADMLVMPSDREGMPLVALEAMAAGLPIVGSNVIGIRELIQGIGSLVDNPSGETFAHTIAGLAAHPDRLYTMSAASRAAAEAYSWDRLTAQVANLYRELQS